MIEKVAELILGDFRTLNVLSILGVCPPISSRTGRHELWGAHLFLLVSYSRNTEYVPSCGPLIQDRTAQSLGAPVKENMECSELSNLDWSSNVLGFY